MGNITIEDLLCFSCIYWNEYTKKPNEIQSGRCHCHSPKPVFEVMGSDSYNKVSWPLTEAVDFCGEHKDR